MKIYTRGGDKGETGLIGGARVAKDDPRVAAYGEVDELNAAIGLVRAQRLRAVLDKLLHDVQHDLFALGAQLADPRATVAARQPKAALAPERLKALEEAIDAHEEALPPLKAFVLPGGTPGGALLHFARAVCRRAERAVVALSQREKVDAVVLAYLNRLSDLLFVLARAENHARGRPEDLW